MPSNVSNVLVYSLAGQCTDPDSVRYTNGYTPWVYGVTAASKEEAIQKVVDYVKSEFTPDARLLEVTGVGQINLLHFDCYVKVQMNELTLL